MVLPELGGRIQRAYDKTNGYDFIYFNRVIKPALVGLAGPWVSGGIEFNWPQHHRPSTFMPVDWAIRENADGSGTVIIGETDRMYGTKGNAEITLYPGKAYIEIKGRLFNPTDIPRHSSGGRTRRSRSTTIPSACSPLMSTRSWTTARGPCPLSP